MLSAYRDHIAKTLDAVLASEQDAVLRAAALVAKSVRTGGVVHTFGSGHSSLVALEPVFRSGSLVPVNQILDKTEDLAERVEGYGSTLMAAYAEQYGLEPDDALIVVSNSGRNPLPLEVARAGRAAGLPVIAISNLAQSRALPSRHGSGQRLFEVADVALDTHAPFGESALTLPGSGQGVAPSPSFPALFLMNGLLLEAARILDAAGEDAPLYQSENADDAGAARRNAELRARYRGRLRRFGA